MAAERDGYRRAERDGALVKSCQQTEFCQPAFPFSQFPRAGENWIEFTPKQ